MRTEATATVSSLGTVRARRPPFEELCHAVYRLLPNNGAIQDIEAKPLSYASSFAIEDITVHLRGGGQVAMVCKDLSVAAMLPEARRIKPDFLRDPFREIAAYASVLAPLHVDAPLFYGAIVDASRDRYWLFLERVKGSPLAEVGEFEIWLQASAWLGELHSALYPERVPAINDVPLLRYDAHFYRRWMQRALRFSDAIAETRARRARLRWLASRYDAVVAQVTGSPVTFVHGEFYASNVIVEITDGGSRIRPLDWELCGIGYPLMDLAALAAGWSENERCELAFSYYAALAPRAPGFLPPESFMRALDCCRVLLAVQCLGWANRWVPPKQHSRDWLLEAVVAAERTGL